MERIQRRVVNWLWQFVVVLCLSCGVLSHTAWADSKAIEVTMLADVTAIQPGKTFTIGALFSIKKPWHVYWKNPGEAGLPTRMKLNLAPGFSASDLIWPVPKQFVQPGNLVGYGYEDSLFLMQEITAPKELKVGELTGIQAEVRWLGCADLCVPGKAVLDLSLPVSLTAQPANQEVFSNWRPLIPKPYKLGDAEFVASLPEKFSISPNKAKFSFGLEWQKFPQSVHWIPVVSPQIGIEKVEALTQSSRTQVNFEAWSKNQSENPAGPLESVVSFVTQNGERRGVVIMLPFGS